MARAVRVDWKSLPDDTHNLLVDTKKMPANRAYKYLKRHNASVVTPITRIRLLAHKEQRQHGIPIKITKKWKGKDDINPRADAGAFYEHKGQKKGMAVKLHPVLQYYDETYVKDVIGHELDHCKVLLKGRDY